MSSDSLSQLFATYRRIRDCMKIARRALDNDNLGMLKDTEFEGQAKPQAATWIDEAGKTTDELAVLALWSVFERYVIEYTQARTGQIEATGPGDFGERLHQRVRDGIERWGLDDFLNLFKTIFDASQGVRDVKKYRDWVAHRNPKRQPPARTDPTSAFYILIFNS
jgi:hypothetical protein